MIPSLPQRGESMEIDLRKTAGAAKHPPL